MMRSCSLPSIVLLFILQTSCRSPQSPSVESLLGLNQIPIITGIYYTTPLMPEGTGEVRGRPSHPLNGEGLQRIKAVPNPLISTPVREDSLNSRGYRKLVFTHLPTSIKIQIVKGIWVGELFDHKSIISGATIYRISSSPLRTIEHVSDLSDGSVSWDLRDDNGNTVPSGFYRIYFIQESENGFHWFDIYLIQPEDFYTWVDPTGWLPEGWNEISIDNGF